MNFLKSYYLYLVFIIIGFAAGLVYVNKISPREKNISNNENGQCEYSLINPLRCDGGNIEQTEYSVFKKKLLDNLELLKKKGDISSASFYFRDLNNGPVFYFNEQEEFAPMSLLKLPMMVAAYKYADSDNKVLDEKIKTPSSFAQNSQIMDKGKTLESDKEYTIEQIVEYMIKYSDNRAVDMLAQWLDSKGENHELIRRTLSDLGIVGYEANLNDAKITVKQYVSIFRILYNASYLSPEMSNRALGILKQAEFRDGLVGKLPKDVEVAHKFGVRAKEEGEQQLHDCGIVYYKPAPYMICIMTRGKDYEKLSSYIEEASKQVFDEVRRRAE